MNEDSDRVVTYMFLALICRGFLRYGALIHALL